MDPKSVLEFAAKNNAKILDLRFIDVPGIWQHVSYPINELTKDSFEEGFGFDASSIRGWASIHESDMLLIPDPNSAFMDPFLAEPTLVMIGDATDPLSHKPYHRDPRHVAKRAEAYLTSTGIADKAFFGAEAEFFIFDSVRFDQAPQHGFYFIDSNEGRWNSGREGDGSDGPNLGYRTRYKEGYFPVPPSDHFQDLRTEMVLKMQAIGMDVECHHHEVATAGQAEIDLRFNTLLNSADNMMKYKYIIKNTAAKAARQSRSCRSRSFRTTARACIPTSRCGRRASPCLQETATRACRRWRSGMRADCSNTPVRFRPSLLRERTRTSVWCRATRRR